MASDVDTSRSPTSQGSTATETGERQRPHLRPRDWRWRQRIRANPQSYHVYRIVVGVVGFIVTVAGLVMVPFPGPGWLVVFIGVSIWASEFHWASRLHRYGIAKVKRWNAWVMRQGLLTRGAIGAATCLFVWAVVWSSIKLSGIPRWVPDDVTHLMRTYLLL